MSEAELKAGCDWLNKGYCMFRKTGCPEDCDLENLEFSEKAIKKQIKSELRKVTILHMKSRFGKNNDLRSKCSSELQDKIIGVYILSNALEKHFGVQNKFNMMMKVIKQNPDKIKELLEKAGIKNEQKK